MKIDQMEQEICDSLLYHLKLKTFNHSELSAYHYCVFPAGKLFRPKLVWGIYLDFVKNNDIPSDLKKHPHSFFSSAIEIHHDYTLAHDDMPCMDDDQFRRGKLSCHAKYSPWEALLTGDGLLNISYSLLSHITPEKLPNLLKFFSWALGPKGLILGQELDLSKQMTQSFYNTLRTHELKTGRLIQLALAGSYLIINGAKNPKGYSEYMVLKKLFKLGGYLGIVFQLLDDLGELTATISKQEEEISPWKNYSKQCLVELSKKIMMIHQICHDLELTNIHSIINNYFIKTHKMIDDNKEQVAKHFASTEISYLDILPMMARLKPIGHN